jgi:SAM-dependent methyltransferase
MIKYFNKNYIDYILLQRTRLKTEYNITPTSPEEDICKALTEMAYKDIAVVHSHLPKIPQLDYKFLDIGCGLATIDVVLSQMYPNSKFYLQDKSEYIDPRRKYNGFNDKYYYYNNIDLLKEFLDNNGVKNYEVIDGDEIYKIPFDEKFDVITSFLSCGWHYTLNTYIDFIKQHLSPIGFLIIDVRDNTDEIMLYQHFHNVDRIYNQNEARSDNGIIGYRYVCSYLK